jgi:hypothetical protein
MKDLILVELAFLGAMTPFVVLALGWMRRTTKMLVDLNLSVVERSSRQDTTLDDHERRITDIEHTIR